MELSRAQEGCTTTHSAVISLLLKHFAQKTTSKSLIVAIRTFNGAPKCYRMRWKTVGRDIEVWISVCRKMFWELSCQRRTWLYLHRADTVVLRKPPDRHKGSTEKRGILNGPAMKQDLKEPSGDTKWIWQTLLKDKTRSMKTSKTAKPSDEFRTRRETFKIAGPLTSLATKRKTSGQYSCKITVRRSDGHKFSLIWR